MVASRDLYVLEMLRNVLDKVKKDKGFQDRMDKLYKERVLQIAPEWAVAVPGSGAVRGAVDPAPAERRDLCGSRTET